MTKYNISKVMYNTMEKLMASVTVFRQTTGIESFQEFSPFLNTNNNLFFC